MIKLILYPFIQKVLICLFKKEKADYVLCKYYYDGSSELRYVFKPFIFTKCLDLTSFPSFFFMHMID